MNPCEKVKRVNYGVQWCLAAIIKNCEVVHLCVAPPSGLCSITGCFLKAAARDLPVCGVFNFMVLNRWHTVPCYFVCF